MQRSLAAAALEPLDDEEVFLAQLHRRARLLNEGFLHKVIAAIRKHTVEDSAAALAAAAGRGHSDPSVVELLCQFCGADAGPAPVEVHAAPIKTVARMREKLNEYRSAAAAGGSGSEPGAAWPLAASILDPVRLSVVVDGPARILEVVAWFTGGGGCGGVDGAAAEAAARRTGLPVCRVKNKFGFRREDVVGGYRDVMLCVVYTGGDGLGIIGEIQVGGKESVYGP